MLYLEKNFEKKKKLPVKVETIFCKEKHVRYDKNVAKTKIPSAFHTFQKTFINEL